MLRAVGVIVFLGAGGGGQQLIKNKHSLVSCDTGVMFLLSNVLYVCLTK